MNYIEPSYLIIGNGKVAKHFANYLILLKLDYKQWSRANNELELINLIKNSSHILLLIKDEVIDSFIETHKLDSYDKQIIHFSGALNSKYAIGCHPLMTFNQDLYPLETYKKILFVCEKNSYEFKDMLPSIENSFTFINKEDKSLYHCMCVMSNNFSTILWQLFYKYMIEKLKVDEKSLTVFLQQTCINIENDYQKSLTGPFPRKDIETINKHIEALDNDPLLDIYQGFVKFYKLDSIT